MKNHSHLIKLFLLLFSFATFAQVKMGDNPSTIGASSALELESATKALLITRVANTAAITSPVNGMLIYDISASCIKGYQNGAWTNCVGSTNNSNGTGIVSAYSCSTASAGSLIAGTAASGATQTITATVITVGTYNISATANGVTFAASGTFAGTGAQNIVLTATGTPIASISTTFTLNTNPNCSFNRNILFASTNGTGVVSAYSCSTASAGTLTAGAAVSGVTQTITATVTTVGTYSISTTANGVTFAASGTFAGIGLQNIVLTATGTPTAAGSTSYTLNTNPNCSFTRTTQSLSSNGTGVVSAYSCSTASAGTLIAGTPVSGVTQTITATVTSVGTYSISTTANGVTFAASGTFAGTGAQDIVLTATGTPTAIGTNAFTLNTNPNCNFSRTTQSISSNGTGVVSAYSCSTASAGTLIVGTAVSGVTQTITATVTIAGTYSISTIANGVTFAASGTFAGTGAQIVVLTATGTPTAIGTNTFTLNTTPNCNFSRATVAPSSNGTGIVSAYSCSTSSAGTLYRGNTASAVTQTITATVTTVGTYSISATANGVTFAASGTFAGTGAQNIVLTATGAPTAAGTTTFTLNTTPNCSFDRTTLDAIPGNITLSPISPYFIASVYDQDYTPYTTPTAAASLATAVTADGTNEAVAITIQGTLTTTGVSINIPYTVVTASVTLPAFSQTLTIPAGYTQDGVTRDITFSYDGATYPVGSGNISATLKAVGGTLNVKQLDVQTGVGTDNLGWLLAQFTYIINGTGGTANFAVRDIAGIPDRNFADANHRMLYLPVLGADGKTWLNNNLGADYSNTSKASFNPAQQATSSTDFRAYGSHYQWGRYSDGHELINYTSGAAGTAVNAPSPGPSSSTSPGSSFLYIPSTGTANWYTGANPNDLWQGVTGTNNPCPIGFRLPTETELNNQRLSWSAYTSVGALASPLKLTMAAFREYNSGSFNGLGTLGNYWISTVSSSASYSGRLYFTSGGYIMYSESDPRARSFSVRCIEDNTPTATISTLTCGSAVVTGTLGNGSAASGVTIAVPYSGGNSGAQFGQSVTSSGVTGLTATLAASIISSSGNFTYAISGTPTSSGTASFAISVGGQSCTLTATVGAAPVYPTGSGALSGTICFDVAISNDNANGCGELSGRTALKADFTLSATNTQTYTFTPSGTVSNVRFVYVNTNGTAITTITGGNSGNNISTAQTATVTYANTLNTTATGLSSSAALTSDIYVIYNNGATNNGADVQIKITTSIKDCACCGAFVASGVYKSFLCHNLGADTTLDPNVPVVGLQGAYIQWGRRGPNTTGDARVDWQTAANTSVFAAAPTAANANAAAIAGWTLTDPGNGSWDPSYKTINDPCPAGYRVPTYQEWTGVTTYNTASRTGTFADSSTNYGAALHYGPNASTKILTLPAAGYINTGSGNGYVVQRGIYGSYYSSTPGNNSYCAYLSFGSNSVSVSFIHLRYLGMSLRCIAQ